MLRAVVRLVVVLIALGLWGLYFYSAFTSAASRGLTSWVNGWLTPAIVATGLCVVVFVLTLVRSGTNGSIVSNLSAGWRRSRVTDPVDGVAQVVSASFPPTSGQNMGRSMCALNLVVSVPGQPSVAVDAQVAAPLAKWPLPGASLPVRAQRDDPRRFKIMWDQVPSGLQAGSSQARMLADRLNSGVAGAGAGGAYGAARLGAGSATGAGPASDAGPSAPGVGGNSGEFSAAGAPPAASFGGVTTSVTINGVPASAEDLAPFEAMTGMDLNGDGMVGGRPAAGATPPGAVPPGTPSPGAGGPTVITGDAARELLGQILGAGGAAGAAGVGGVAGAADPVSRLERLTALRDAGALSDAQFEAAKRQLLGQ